MKATPLTFRYGQDQLTVPIALAISNGEIKGYLSPKAMQRIVACREAVDEIVREDRTVYGINTGFGAMCSTRISPENTRQLQYNLLRSHSVGVGEPIPLQVAKLMLILKVNALAYGYSGVAPATIERLIWHIDQDIIPWVPSQGSVGASGDLAPLSHMCLPLIGGGKLYYQGTWTDTAYVLQAENLAPIELGAKEGLALINGTQFMAAYGILVVDRLENCLDHADILGAMMIEGMLGSQDPFREELHQLRPYPGTLESARRIRSLLEGSEILASHADCGKVQDPYSLRCMPQVHGASRNAWNHLRQIVEIELNAVTDNPIVFNAGHTLSGGNFHGQPIALPLDYATLAAAELGNIADRRIYLALMGESGLPKLLMKDTGLNSGFMVFQFTTASLVTENKSLCFPASADSVPTSLGQEDHVSMGAISGRKALRVLENVEKIQAIELLCAAQAFDFRRPLSSSPPLEACYQHVRQGVQHADQDRVFTEDLEMARSILQSKQLRRITEAYLSGMMKGELQ